MKSDKPRSRIGQLREKIGMTQLELSRIVGVTETTIANWEKGRSGTEWIEKITKLCRALNCQLEDLIERESAESVPEEQTRKTSLSKLRQVYKAAKFSRKKNMKYIKSKG